MACPPLGPRVPEGTCASRSCVALFPARAAPNHGIFICRWVLILMAHSQLSLFQELRVQKNSTANRLDPRDRAFHDWYRFVLSFPPHLVRDYIQDFGLTESSMVLDPFCGTGTSLVECKLNHIPAIGIEANPFAQFASSVKVDWEIDPDLLWEQSQRIAEGTIYELGDQGIDDEKLITEEIDPSVLKKLDNEEMKLLLARSISPVPLHKVLSLRESLKPFQGERNYGHLLLALAKTLVFSASNLHFGPEVGVGKEKTDAPVVSFWLQETGRMADDLRALKGNSHPAARSFLADSREGCKMVGPAALDAVITSPPYPNEKDYTRITRLESVILGMISSKAELQKHKKKLVRSNTRNVYKGDDDDRWVLEHPKIQEIADEIEQRRLELGKTSGFERLYAKVTKLYFGGMARHLAELRTVLRPGAHLAYVVGDQASYLRVMIRTGQLLGEIAEKLGYELVRTDLFRTRLATATKEQLREEVVVLRWPKGA